MLRTDKTDPKDVVKAILILGIASLLIYLLGRVTASMSQEDWDATYWLILFN